MSAEEQLRAKLRQISKRFEKPAADAAEQPVEYQVTLPERWERRLFVALCRRHGLEPYRYRRQKSASVVVRLPRSFLDNTLWPEYELLRQALDDYVAQTTERIIAEEVSSDVGEAREPAR